VATNNSTVIHTAGLTKYYGKHRGMIDISLDVRQGEVFGYLGPNGAGKTTTIRTLLNLIRPTRGMASIFGMDIQRLGSLRGGADWAHVEDLAARFDCDLLSQIRSLSHGNRQKIGLIQAFMNTPDLLILDEPSIGLDPLMQQEFYRLVDEAKAEGRTVFLSSHIMPEVERVCDRVAIIREGQLVTVEDIDNLKARSIRRLEIHFDGPVSQETFTEISGVKDVRVHDSVLTCTVVGQLDALVKAASQSTVVNIISHEPSLEEIFLDYYHEGESIA